MTVIDAQLAAIEAMSSRERKAEWQRRLGSIAPPAFGSGLLARALAHDVQVRAMGGLGKADQRRLTRMGSPGKIEATGDGLKPGTWLSRTWHGEVHQVVVLDSGFEYNGHRFGSLSEIANRITGTRWSGPRFFGLNSPRLGKLGTSADGE